MAALVRGREGLPLSGRPHDSVPRPWPHTFLSPGQTPSTLPLVALSRSTLSRAGCSYFKSSMGVSPRDIQAHEPDRRGVLSAQPQQHLLADTCSGLQASGLPAQTLPERSP